MKWSWKQYFLWHVVELKYKVAYSGSSQVKYKYLQIILKYNT